MTRQRPGLLVMLVLLLFALGTRADIYQWRDAQGKLHFSDQKPEDKSSTVISATPVNSFTSVSYELPPLPPAATRKRPQPVVMYVTQRCGYCKKARKYFQNTGIAFSEYDIDASESARAAYDRLGGRGVPMIFVGKARMDGFSEDGFKRFYAAQTGITPAAR